MESIIWHNLQTFKKIIISQQRLTQNMWFIGVVINISSNKLQKVSFKNKLIWKNQKDYERTHIPFIK
jgi:hypothetical protein